MGNGGVLASLRMLSCRTITSTSPVAIFRFVVSGERRCTRPFTAITYSERRRFAFAIVGSSSLSKTICVRPARSRMSMKSTPPRSRTRWTHPSSTTSAPTSSARSAPHVCVRVKSPRCSATLHLQHPLHHVAGAGLRSHDLFAGGEVLDSHLASFDLVLAEDGHAWDTASFGILELLADLIGLGVHKHPQIGIPEQAGYAKRVRKPGGVEGRDHDVGRVRPERGREHAPLAHDDQDPLEAQREPARGDALA